MKKINVRFEADENLDGVEIVFRASERDEQVEALMKKLSDNAKRRLAVLDGRKNICRVDEADVISVSADGKTVRIAAESGAYHARQTLKEIETELSDERFLRISRFEIINLKKVAKYDFTVSGMLRIEFENGAETWASRRYIPLIRERLSKGDDHL